MVELADATGAFNSNSGANVCKTTSGAAPSDPYVINCDNFYDLRYLKIGRPNAANTEHLCMSEIEVYG